MWYYKRTEPGLWTVGYGAGSDWVSDSDHDDRDSAAERVAFLNGNTNTQSDVLERIATAMERQAEATERQAATLETLATCVYMNGDGDYYLKSRE